MLLHTIVDPLGVLAPSSFDAEYRSISGGGYCECVGDGNGFVLRRLISTNPADYLRAELQPGTLLSKESHKPLDSGFSYL